MKTTIMLNIPGEPVPQGRPRFHSRNGFVSVYDPPASKKYKEYVANFAKEHYAWNPIEGMVMMNCNFYLPIPKSWPKKKQEMARNHEIRPSAKPDWDNYAKAMCDGLNGVLYKDDGQIVESSVKLFYCDEPRAEVEVYEI